jgi:hypothetical protein
MIRTNLKTRNHSHVLKKRITGGSFREPFLFIPRKGVREKMSFFYPQDAHTLFPREGG